MDFQEALWKALAACTAKNIGTVKVASETSVTVSLINAEAVDEVEDCVALSGGIPVTFCEHEYVLESTGSQTNLTVPRTVVSYPTQPICDGVWEEVGEKLCHKASAEGGCATKVFSTGGRRFSEVSGQVLAYQQGTPDAFGAENGGLDTISIWTTSGIHIWTYAVGMTQLMEAACPCYFPCSSRCPPADGTPAPNYLGENFYCDSGNPECDGNIYDTFYPQRLFEGAAPFTRYIGSTFADIEVRVCLDQEAWDEDIYF